MPDYKPLHTQIVNPDGVDTSIAPRAMAMTTDESRAQTVQTTGGDPLVDFDGKSNPYIDYQSIDYRSSVLMRRISGIL